MLSNSKAFSNGRFLLVIQASIFHLDRATPPGDISFVTNRVVVKLADELVPREAFTHHDVNVLLRGK